MTKRKRRKSIISAFLLITVLCLITLLTVGSITLVNELKLEHGERTFFTHAENRVLIKPGIELKNLPLILLVLSSAERMEQRLAIRNTWAAEVKAHGFGLLFACGRSNGTKLEDEASMFHDILQVDAENAQNTSIMLTSMKYLYRNSRSDFILKTQDDVYCKYSKINTSDCNQRWKWGNEELGTEKNEEQEVRREL